MFVQFKNLRVAGVAAAVPAKILEMSSLAARFGEDEVRRALQVTGIERSRVADPKTTAADLCFIAASTLLTDLALRGADIDALVFVTTTPDFLVPPTSHILQGRLGLSEHVACFDLTFACSGYIYGLLQAAMLLHAGAAKRVLLLSGDTPTKCLSPDDRALRLLFGDAGTATVVEASPGATGLAISVHTDGGRHEHIIWPNSGVRRSSAPSYLTMNGGEVFNFVAKQVPVSIVSLLQKCQLAPLDIDCYVLHQASKKIVDFVMTKLEIRPGIALHSLKDFGNTGPASIPLSLIVDPKRPALKTRKTLLAGFGVGLSWGVALADLSRTHFSAIVQA